MMSKHRVKALIAVLLVNIFIIAYSIKEIGLNKLLLISMPVTFLSVVLFIWGRNNKKILSKAPKKASVIGIVIGLLLARFLHGFSPILEISFAVFIGAVSIVLVLIVSDEDLIER